MKIGIATIYHTTNYGAILQCYSLCRVLQEMGHEVFLYDIPFSRSNKHLSHLKRIVLNGKFERFIKNHLPASTTNLSATADLYMVGSDQVWNSDIVGDRIYDYMLAFAPAGSPKTSYAASFGKETWTDQERFSECQRLLKDLRAISVREDSGRKILKEQFHLDGETVLDPCLLPTSFSEIIGKATQESNSLVSYKLVYSQQWHAYCKKLAKTLGCHFTELAGRRIPSLGPLKEFNAKKCSVEQWLTSIASAKYVVTDSFHGTVFSILFHRQFVVVPGVKGRSTRLKSLLTVLGLEERYVTDQEKIASILQKGIDYTSVDKKLASLREQSKDFLAKSLSL